MIINFPRNISIFHALFFTTIVLCIGVLFGNSLNIILILAVIAIFALMVVNLESGLYILLISSFLFHPLDAYQLPIGGSNIRFLDILVVMFLIAWIIRLITKKDSIPFKSPVNTFLYIIIGILFAFLIIGILKGRNAITVLRDARAIPYYLSAFAIACIIQNHEQLKKIVRILIILSLIGLFYYYLMRILNISFESGLSTLTLTTMRYTRAYGFYSTWPYFALSFFMLISFLMLNKFKPLQSLTLWCLAIAFLSALLLTLLRMYFLGAVSGCSILFFLLWYEGRRTFILKSLIILSVVIIIFICLYLYIPENKLIHHPMVERYLSIFTPSVSTKGAMVTRQDRFNAILYFTRSERNSIFIGEGFGDVVRDHSRRHLLWHSSLGWAFYRLGIIPSIVFYLVMGGFLIRTIIYSKKIIDIELKAIYYGFMCFYVFLLTISATSGVLFDKVNEMTLVGFTLGVFLSLDNIANDMSEEDKVAFYISK